ncbi:RNA 3'-terminal phosphate cyclase [Paludisphaera rhizosphaerae]|uniref:RNA 3'-terminal phosphate cyclase n=1 Tax=Paludisphaera rhizosphaerae TaxID=2711216 RepID=UPI00197CF673|nr:RNA 3'-terminal phosphate cyclase [Paludisphaera rhizosphaerae]
MSSPKSPSSSERLVVLDGSHGEGGGQILRTALSLSLLTGKPFRIVKIRANRDKPGLRPQHKMAVEAAARLGRADVLGAEVGSRDLVFRPGSIEAGDLTLDIGTAGSTGLVLQTLHLPLAMRSETARRVALTGGTFNPKAPAFLFLEQTWRGHLANLGMPLALAMPSAGFYPKGGGRLEAWIEPAQPRPWIRTTRGDLVRIRGVAGTSNLRDDVARRMRERALSRLADEGWNVEIDIETASWPSPGQGAAIALTAEHAGTAPAAFVGLGERGKPAEQVADEAVDELLDFLAVPDAAVDPHSADQILLPLALAEGRSVYTVSEVTDHLRTNVATIRAFLDREIEVEEPVTPDQPGRVVIS